MPSTTSDADEGHEAHERLDEPGLQQVGERVDVGGHAGHDPTRHLAVVVVEREPLEMREDPDAQRVEQSLGGAARVARVGPREQPVGGDGEEEAAPTR